jgi:hypothetical protein
MPRPATERELVAKALVGRLRARQPDRDLH